MITHTVFVIACLEAGYTPPEPDDDFPPTDPDELQAWLIENNHVEPQQAFSVVESYREALKRMEIRS